MEKTFTPVNKTVDTNAQFKVVATLYKKQLELKERIGEHVDLIKRMEKFSKFLKVMKIASIVALPIMAGLFVAGFFDPSATQTMLIVNAFLSGSAMTMLGASITYAQLTNKHWLQEKIEESKENLAILFFQEQKVEKKLETLLKIPAIKEAFEEHKAASKMQNQANYETVEKNDTKKYTASNEDYEIDDDTNLPG